MAGATSTEEPPEEQAEAEQEERLEEVEKFQRDRDSRRRPSRAGAKRKALRYFNPRVGVPAEADLINGHYAPPRWNDTVLFEFSPGLFAPSALKEELSVLRVTNYHLANLFHRTRWVSPSLSFLPGSPAAPLCRVLINGAA